MQVIEHGMCIFINNGRKKVNQLHSVISNRDINLTTRKLLLLSVIRPSIEYGGEFGRVIRAKQLD